MSGPGSHPPQPLDALVADLTGRIRDPLALTQGPWPVPTGGAGVGDEAMRALLVDDWAGARTSAAKLQKLIDTQLVSRHRELAAEHPDGRDLGITVDGRTVGRLLLDLAPQPAFAAVVLVDIAIHPDRQRQGIGSRLVQSLMETAADHHRSVRATAVYGSAALRWLQRLGMIDVGGDALYRELLWPAP